MYTSLIVSFSCIPVLVNPLPPLQNTMLIYSFPFSHNTYHQMESWMAMADKGSYWEESVAYRVRTQYTMIKLVRAMTSSLS